MSLFCLLDIVVSSHWCKQKVDASINPFKHCLYSVSSRHQRDRILQAAALKQPQQELQPADSAFVIRPFRLFDHCEKYKAGVWSTWTFISLSVSQILTTRTSPDVMRRPVSCSQSTTMPAPANTDDISTRCNRETRCEHTHTFTSGKHQHPLM